VIGAIWYPHDGKCNPIDTTMALAKGARMAGVKFHEDTLVTKIIMENGKAVGVETAEGTIRAETIVIAGGMWTRELAKTIGVDVPLQACEHFYIVTDPMVRHDARSAGDARYGSLRLL